MAYDGTRLIEAPAAYLAVRSRGFSPPFRLNRKGRAVIMPHAICSVEGCSSPVRCVALCQIHYRRLLRNGSPTATRQMGRPRSPEVTYNSVHLRLRRDRGPARNHPCADCGQRAQAWSYDHSDPDEVIDHRGRPYSTDQGRYEPRCWPCHNPIDRAAKAKRDAA